MKICKKCNKEKELSEYRVEPENRDGRVGTCKACQYGHEPHKRPTVDKTCTVCKELKLLIDYQLIKPKNSTIKFHSSICRKCQNTRRTEKRKLNPTKEKLRQKNKKLKQDYKISLEQYNQMLENQDFKCKICKKPQEDLLISLAIDHCHTTNKIRGLLCTNCNLGIGMFKDNIISLGNAIEYLKSSI